MTDDPVTRDTGELAIITGRTPATIRTVCTRGPHGYDVTAAETALATVRGEVEALTPADIEARTGIPAGTVYVWAHRERIRPVDHDQHGRPLYALAHLLRLHSRDQRRAQLDL